ncbi:hypothetical protein AA0121_g13618 [Alternaria tenuissima]|nr:hypothetical protein AA0121_g13618 [Alternaria tenuissima]
MSQLSHSTLEVWIQETVSAFEERRPRSFSIYAESVLLNNTTVWKFFAARGSTDLKCIGAIGYKKLYEKEATNETVLMHTVHSLTGRVSAVNALMMIPIFNLHQGTWVTRYYTWTSGQAQKMVEVEGRTGTTTELAVKSEIGEVLEFNLLGFCPAVAMNQYCD